MELVCLRVVSLLFSVKCGSNEFLVADFSLLVAYASYAAIVICPVVLALRLMVKITGAELICYSTRTTTTQMTR